MNTVYITTPGLWVDNRVYDNMYYYVGGNTDEKGIVYNDTPDQVKTIQLFRGIQDFAPISNGSLYLEIRAEAVQINRINAFWGMTQLPQ